MYKDKKILVIIPARGGSKSVPQKNIVDLNKKPLISYSIDIAKKSKYIDRIVVTSDNDEIISVAKEYNAETIKRPPELAQDNSKMDGAIKHVLTSYQEKENYFPDYIVLLQPTSPLRTENTVNSAIESFVEKNQEYDSLTSLISLGGKIGKIQENRYNSMQEIGRQRQEIEPYYKECGTVFIFKPELILADKFFGERVFPFIIKSGREALDIDTYEDLDLSNYYLNISK